MKKYVFYESKNKKVVHGILIENGKNVKHVKAKCNTKYDKYSFEKGVEICLARLKEPKFKVGDMVYIRSDEENYPHGKIVKINLPYCSEYGETNQYTYVLRCYNSSGSFTFERTRTECFLDYYEGEY